MAARPAARSASQHAERLNADGTVYTANLRSAKQRDVYVCRGDGEEVFEPRFTYHGFRYVEVRGLTEKPRPSDLVGRVFHSAAPEVGRFECSNPLINQLMHNAFWSQLGNLTSIPTDCPQRDERAGWMGDIQAFSQTAIFNMDMAAFFTKWLADVRDSQADDGRFSRYLAPSGRSEREPFRGLPPGPMPAYSCPGGCIRTTPTRGTMPLSMIAIIPTTEITFGTAGMISVTGVMLLLRTVIEGDYLFAPSSLSCPRRR